MKLKGVNLLMLWPVIKRIGMIIARIDARAWQERRARRIARRNADKEMPK